MKDLYTVADIAAKRGCNKATVTRRAAALSLGSRIGNVLVFTPAEMKRIIEAIQDRPGNPLMGTGQPKGWRSDGRPKGKE